MDPWNGLLMALFVFIVMELVDADEETTSSSTQVDDLIPERYNKTCYDGDQTKGFGGPNCFAWVVRISIIDWFDKNATRLIATGNIITEDWILTACTPFHQVIEEERWDTIRVMPAVSDYTEVQVQRSKGVFPYCLHLGGCIVGHYLVVQQKYKTVDGRDCLNSTNKYPDGMNHNMLLVRMASKIKVNAYKLFPRMPFSYSVESLVRKIDWFNTYRKARCVVVRVTPNVTWPQDDPEAISYTDGNLYEQKGFTYRTMPYRAECLPTVCTRNCLDVANTDQCKKEEAKEKGSCWLLEQCMTNCRKKMEPLLGAVMCLVRMDEHSKGVTLIKTETYDNTSQHTDWPEKNECKPDTAHPAGNNPHYMGAPVVCDGEVIAIVTKCEDTFIMATSIVPIRHRLLKLFDTSYQKSLVFLSEA